MSLRVIPAALVALSLFAGNADAGGGIGDGERWSSNGYRGPHYTVNVRNNMHGDQFVSVTEHATGETSEEVQGRPDADWDCEHSAEIRTPSGDVVQVRQTAPGSWSYLHRRNPDGSWSRGRRLPDPDDGEVYEPQIGDGTWGQYAAPDVFVESRDGWVRGVWIQGPGGSWFFLPGDGTIGGLPGPDTVHYAYVDPFSDGPPQYADPFDVRKLAPAPAA